MDSLDEYDTFHDLGPAKFVNGKLINAPEGYKRIRTHLVFDVKHDGRHKARLVAGGHMTGPPNEDGYSGGVSIIIFGLLYSLQNSMV